MHRGGTDPLLKIYIDHLAIGKPRNVPTESAVYYYFILGREETDVAWPLLRSLATYSTTTRTPVLNFSKV